MIDYLGQVRYTYFELAWPFDDFLLFYIAHATEKTPCLRIICNLIYPHALSTWTHMLLINPASEI